MSEPSEITWRRGTCDQLKNNCLMENFTGLRLLQNGAKKLGKMTGAS
jgi:hypothetical protein